MGFFEAASNVVGLPGSMVRDVIGGENPFDQLLDPFGEEDRLNITEATGLEGIPGFLAEMLLDPLNLLAGVGVAKSLPKLLKARKVAKAAKLERKMGRLRKAGNVRGGVASGATRRQKQVQKAIGESSAFGRDGGIPNWLEVLDDHNLVTEGMARKMGLTLKGPSRAGLLSRIGSRLGVAGGGLKEAGRYGFGQFRNLPRYSQAVIAPKALGGLERGLFGDEEESIGIEEILNNPELMEILMEQALLGGDAGTPAVISQLEAELNEPLNIASPLDMLDMNSPEPEFSGPSVGRRHGSPLGWRQDLSAPDLRDEYSAPSLRSGLFLEDNPFGL
jgi:hypothetical protein